MEAAKAVESERMWVDRKTSELVEGGKEAVADRRMLVDA
jgi:hypothetical protein